MSHYDRAITVFSPDGQLLQVQYAQEVSRKGSACVGIRGENSIVLAVEKRSIHKLQVERTEKKIVPLDEHIVLAFAGLKADARVLISRSQIECQSYKLAVEDLAPVEYITKYMANLMHQYTHSNGRRPFGISCLIAGHDYDGSPHLFQTEPSGVYNEWKANSIGRCDKTVLQFLEKNYSSDLVATDNGAIKLALQSLLQVPNLIQKNIEVALVKMNQPVKMLDAETINFFIEQILREVEEAETEDKK